MAIPAKRITGRTPVAPPAGRCEVVWNLFGFGDGDFDDVAAV